MPWYAYLIVILGITVWFAPLFLRTKTLVLPALWIDAPAGAFSFSQPLILCFGRDIFG